MTVIIFWGLLLTMAFVGAGCICLPLLKSTSSSFFQRRFLAGLFFFLIPVLSLSFYFYQSNGKAFSQYLVNQDKMKQQAIAVEKLRAQLGTPEQVIAKMKEKLAQDPSSVQGWYLLGRLYNSMNRYLDAVAAFSKAYHLQPENKEVALQYAQAMFFANNYSLKGESKAILDHVLAKEPHELAALNLLAIDAYHKKLFNQAISYWQQMLADSSLDDDNRRSIEDAIAKAQNLLHSHVHLSPRERSPRSGG